MLQRLYLAGPGGLLRASCPSPLLHPSMGSALRASLRLFKFDPVELVGPHFVRSNSLPANLSNLYRFSSFLLSSINAHIHQRLCLAGPGGLLRTSMYSALRASLRLFKFAPGKFVEPLIGSHLSDSYLLTLIYISVSFWLGREDSNLRIPGSKPGALPLGDGPILLNWLVPCPRH